MKGKDLTDLRREDGDLLKDVIITTIIQS